MRQHIIPVVYGIHAADGKPVAVSYEIDHKNSSQRQDDRCDDRYDDRIIMMPGSFHYCLDLYLQSSIKGVSSTALGLLPSSTLIKVSPSGL